MGIKKQLELAAAELRNKAVMEIYERLSATNEWQGRNKTQRLYMMCIEADVTAPVMTAILKQLNIENLGVQL